MKFVFYIKDAYNPNYHTDLYSHYMVVESVQFINRERGDHYHSQGSICIGYPKFFFKVSVKNSPGGTIAEIIDSKEIRYRSSFSTESYHKDKIYDFSIRDLTIFKKENFNFSVEDNRDQRIDEILKEEEI